MNQYPMQAPPPQPPKKSNMGLCLIIAAVVAGLGVIVVILFLVLGFYGTRKYLSESKKVEGKVTAGAIARGMVACMEREEVSATGEASTRKELPPSSPAVPAAVPSGAKYMSSPSDWTSPAFTCARFTMSTPQYFQYQWERTSPMSGVVHARADLDGDGAVEVNLEIPVSCTAGSSCNVGVLVEK